MQQLLKCLKPIGWSLSVAMVLLLMPARESRAQMLGYGVGVGVPSGGGFYNGYPSVSYPFTSFGTPYPGMVYGGGGLGYGGLGYGGYGFNGLGYGGYPYGGMGYYGAGYGPGYAGFYGTGFRNPMFGVGLTPLGSQSYMAETRLFGRVPRVNGRYGRSAYFRPNAFRGW